MTFDELVKQEHISTNWRDLPILQKFYNKGVKRGIEMCEAHDQKKIESLKAKIEKMKCCGNCKYKDCNKTSRYQTCWYCKNKDKWELKE